VPARVLFPPPSLRNSWQPKLYVCVLTLDQCLTFHFLRQCSSRIPVDWFCPGATREPQYVFSRSHPSSSSAPFFLALLLSLMKQSPPIVIACLPAQHLGLYFCHLRIGLTCEDSFFSSCIFFAVSSLVFSPSLVRAKTFFILSLIRDLFFVTTGMRLGQWSEFYSGQGTRCSFTYW